jgi:hypothetical protein
LPKSDNLIILNIKEILNMVKNREITEEEVIDFINNRTCSL